MIHQENDMYEFSRNRFGTQIACYFMRRARIFRAVSRESTGVQASSPRWERETTPSREFPLGVRCHQHSTCRPSLLRGRYSRSLVDYWGYFAPSYFGISHRGHLCWTELLPNFERVRALGCSRRARPRRPYEIYPLTPRIGCGQERQAHHLSV